MKIIIVGVGKVGQTLTQSLSEEGHDIIVVDTDGKLVESVVERYDVRGVIGNGASYEILLEAEVTNTDLIIATTDRDEVNILSCLVAKRYGVQYSVARVRNPEYSNQVAFYHDELGINLIINPELETAREMVRIITYPSATTIETFAKGRVDLVEILVKEDSPLVGIALKDLRSKFQVRVLVCAIERYGEAFIPSGDFVIEANDRIHYTAAEEELIKSFKKFEILKRPIHNLLIIGGSHIAYYLVKMLERRDMTIKILEVDETRAIELSEQLTNASIIHGEGTDHELLIEEGIENADAVITLTGLDEENMILSLFASQIGVPKVITKLNRYHYSNILNTLNLDSVLSPKELCANIIIRYVRSLENAVDHEMLTLYKLINHEVEAAEFRVHEESSITGIPFRDLKLKNEVLIASIIRGNHHIIPSGLDMIKPGDRIIIVSKHQMVRSLEDILER